MENLMVKLRLLMDITDKKIDLLNKVYSITENQETILRAEGLPDKNSFLNGTVDEKQKLIDEILTADELFQSVYSEINYELKNNANTYKDDVINLQLRIKEAIDMDVKIRVKEQHNNDLNLFKPVIKSNKASKKYILNQYSNQNKFEKS